MACVVWLVALISLSSVWTESVPEPLCASPEISQIKFSLKSHRNGSGYWILEFDFDNDGVNKSPSDGVGSPSWSVGMQQSAESCGDNKSSLHSKIIVAMPDGSSPTKPIPAGYELFPGVGYYKFHSDAAIWARARQVCAEEGAHLIVLNSEYEANVLKQLFTRFPKEKITNYDGSLYEWSWIGVFEQGAKGRYFTIQGQTLGDTGYSRWHTNQPDGVGSNDCVVADALGAGYSDILCSNRAAFICEV